MPDPTYTETRTPEIIINTLDDKSKLSQITVGEHELVLVPDDFSQIDNIQIHGVDQPIVDNTVDLSVVEQVSVFPEATSENEGRMVQFIGTGGAGTTGWFYKCTEYNIPYSLEVEGDSTVTVSSYNAETFISQLSDPTEDATLEFVYNGTNWELDGTEVSLNTYGISITGTPVSGSTITGTYIASTEGYRWVQTDTQPTEEYHESFFRGPFGTWANVPDVGHEDQYYADFYGNHRPGLTDYIVVANPVDYVPSETTQIIRLFTHSTGGQDASMDVTVVSTGQTYNYLHSTIRNTWTNIPDTDLQIAYQMDGGMNYSLRNTKAPMIVNGVWYAQNATYDWVFSTAIDVPVNGYNVYRGMWRFAYTSNSWDSDGKNGWKPEYQIENVLPIADSQTLGIAKLYTTTGQNTDGSITQKAVSDAINDIQQSFFRGKFGNFTNVPTSASGYEPEPGTQDQKTPTKNDFIVVLDASDYIAPDFTEQFTFSWNPNDGRVTWTYNAVTTVVGDGTYPVTFGPDNCMYITQGGGLRVNKTSKWGATILYPNSSPQWLSGSVSYNCATTGSAGLYQGSWRFYYDGTWDVEGKTGWLPQYQVEGVLPVADSSNLGIAKLYDSLGNNTDGAVDQATVTTALDTKQDTLTASTGIEIDENNNISTNNIVWKIWPTE